MHINLIQLVDIDIKIPYAISILKYSYHSEEIRNSSKLAKINFVNDSF